MTKAIQIGGGYETLVDDADYESLSTIGWSHKLVGGSIYAVSSSRINGKKYQTYMHRRIMLAPKGLDVDHINRNGLDNRRENLRLCTKAENQRNRGKTKSSTSGFKGVTWHNTGKKWIARITADKKPLHLGLFATKEEAARAYDAAAIKLHGEFAYLNFQTGDEIK